MQHCRFLFVLGLLIGGAAWAASEQKSAPSPDNPFLKFLRDTDDSDRPSMVQLTADLGNDSYYAATVDANFGLGKVWQALAAFNYTQQETNVYSWELNLGTDAQFSDNWTGRGNLLWRTYFGVIRAVQLGIGADYAVARWGKEAYRTTLQLDLAATRYWQPVVGKFFYAKLGVLQTALTFGVSQELTHWLTLGMAFGVNGYLSDSGNDLSILVNFGYIRFPRVANLLSGFINDSLVLKAHVQYSEPWSSDFKITRTHTALTHIISTAASAQVTYQFNDNWTGGLQATYGHSPGIDGDFYAGFQVGYLW